MKICVLGFLCFSFSCFSQSPATDFNFGKNGASFVNINDSLSYIFYSDHDIDAAGNMYMIAHRMYDLLDKDDIIIKVNAAGKLDSTFFENGFRNAGINVVTFSYQWPNSYHKPDFVRALANQKVQVFSNNGANLVTLRLKPDGLADSTYGVNGFKLHSGILPSRDILLTPDGGFLSVATQHFTSSTTYDIIITKNDSNGDPDLSFNGTGKLTITLDGTYTYQNSILLAGNSLLLNGVWKKNGSSQNDSVTVIKVRATGIVDPGFGRNGIATNTRNFTTFSDDYNYSDRMMLLPDSSIMVIKAYDYNGGGIFSQFKFTKTGARDNTFGTNGAVFNDFFNGKSNRLLGRYKDPMDPFLWMTKRPWIPITDSTCYVVMKIKPDGNVDSSYYKPSRSYQFIDSNGFARFDQHSTVFNNQLIGVSGNTIIGKLKSNGNYDSSYAVNGKAPIIVGSSLDQLLSISPMSNGKMVALASDCRASYLVGLTAVGTRDNSFGNGSLAKIDDLTSVPTVVTNENMHLAVDNSNRILVVLEKIIGAGPNISVTVKRFKSNGVVDSSFGVNGAVEITGPNVTECKKIITQYDNKILLLGDSYTTSQNSDILVARLNENGTVDNSFGTNGIKILGLGASHDIPRSILVLKDSTILVAGGEMGPDLQVLVKLNSNGQQLQRVNIEGNAESDTYFLAETDSGKIIISLNKYFNYTYQFTSAYRLNKNLTYDMSYPYTVYQVPSTINYFTSGQLLYNGKLVLGGIQYQGAKNIAVSLGIKKDGGIDSTWGVNGLLTYKQLLPDTTTATLPAFGVYSLVPKLTVFRDAAGQLISATTAKRNEFSDIFITRNLMNDFAPPGKLTVWSRQICTGSNKIILKINGLRDSITTTLASEPSCNAGGAVTFTLPAGNYELKAYCGNDSIVSDISVIADNCVKKEISFSIVTPVTDVNQSGKNFKVIPNPASTVCNIVFEATDKGLIRIFDLHGKELTRQSFNGTTCTLNTKKLPAGTYIIDVSGKKYKGSRLLVKIE